MKKKRSKENLEIIIMIECPVLAETVYTHYKNCDIDLLQVRCGRIALEKVMQTIERLKNH